MRTCKKLIAKVGFETRTSELTYSSFQVDHTAANECVKFALYTSSGKYNKLDVVKEGGSWEKEAQKAYAQ